MDNFISQDLREESSSRLSVHAFGPHPRLAVLVGWGGAGDERVPRRPAWGGESQTPVRPGG